MWILSAKLDRCMKVNKLMAYNRGSVMKYDTDLLKCMPYLISRLSKLECVLLATIYKNPYIRRNDLSEKCRKLNVSYSDSMDKALKRLQKHGVVKIYRPDSKRVYYLITERYEPLAKLLYNMLMVESL